MKEFAAESLNAWQHWAGRDSLTCRQDVVHEHAALVQLPVVPRLLWHANQHEECSKIPVGLNTASHALLSRCCTEGSTKAGLDQNRTRASADRPKAVLEGLMAAAALCPSAALMLFLLDVAPSPARQLVVSLLM